MSALEIRQFRAFGRHVENETARDLTLLNQIQATLDYLDVEQLRIEQTNCSAEKLIEIAKLAESQIDKTGDLVESFEKSRDTISNIYSGLITARQSAIDDDRLEDEDGIVEAYSSLIAGFADLHNNLNTLAWIIGENSADFDTSVSKNYADTEEMFADLEA